MPLAAVKNKFPLLSQMACDSPLKRLQLAPNEVFVGLPFRKVGPFIRSQDDSSFYSLFCHLNINYLIGGQIFCES